MTGNGGIGHPKFWVVMRNVKDRMSSSLVDHACCYGHFTLKEAQRDVETSWDKSIRINWFWIEAKQQRHRALRLDRH